MAPAAVVIFVNFLSSRLKQPPLEDRGFTFCIFDPWHGVSWFDVVILHTKISLLREITRYRYCFLHQDTAQVMSQLAPAAAGIPLSPQTHFQASPGSGVCVRGIMRVWESLPGEDLSSFMCCDSGGYFYVWLFMVLAIYNS